MRYLHTPRINLSVLCLFELSGKPKLYSQDLSKEKNFVRPSSSGRKAEKSSAKGGPKQIGEIKDILELAGEFKEMVTQMAFEKFDFHQWFRCVYATTARRGNLRKVGCKA